MVDPRLRLVLTRMVAGDLFNNFLAIYRNPVLRLDERHATHGVQSVSLDRHSTVRSKGGQETTGCRLCAVCCIVVVLIISIRLQVAQNGCLHYTE